MSEFEPSKINYSESELSPVVKRAAEVLNAYFYKKLIESAGKREIKSETIEALAKYWVVSIAKYLDFLTSDFLNYGLTKALDTLKAVTGTDEELIKYFLYHFDKRDLGLKEYSECLGFDIEKFIDEKITPNGKPKFNILDIGCAEGVFLEQVEKKYGNKVEIWGLAHGYEGAEGKDGINFKLGLMELMPEKFDSKFDLVTTLNAVMYSADPELAFDQSINSLNKMVFYYLLVEQLSRFFPIRRFLAY